MADAPVTLTPHLTCRNAAEAVEFYQKAFGAESLGIHTMDDGRVMHAALCIAGNTLFVCDEFPECGGKSPLSLGGTPVTLHLQVPDCDAAFERAVAAGCTVAMPLQDMFWGDRYGSLSDPYGHHWSIATTVRKLTAEEIQQALKECLAASGGECSASKA